MMVGLYDPKLLKLFKLRCKKSAHLLEEVAPWWKENPILILIYWKPKKKHVQLVHFMQ